MTQTLTAVPLAEAVGIAKKLLQLVDRHGADSLSLAPQEFRKLGVLIDCLPLNQDEYCYFSNRLGSTERLLNEGEVGAAGYQLREMHRKLVRVLADRT